MKRSLHRPIRKKDGNQNDIELVWQQVGAFVEDIHTLGEGAPDDLVFFRGTWIPVEIKASVKDKLTPAEVIWWHKVGIPPIIAYDQETALRAIGLR